MDARGRSSRQPGASRSALGVPPPRTEAPDRKAEGAAKEENAGVMHIGEAKARIRGVKQAGVFASAIVGSARSLDERFLPLPNRPTRNDAVLNEWIEPDELLGGGASGEDA